MKKLLIAMLACLCLTGCNSKWTAATHNVFGQTLEVFYSQSLGVVCITQSSDSMQCLPASELNVQTLAPGRWTAMQ